MKRLCLFFFYIVSFCDCVEVSLRKRSTLYLPYTYQADNTGSFGIDRVAIEQTTHDHERQILYGVGDTILHAIDVSDPDNMTVLSYLQYPGMEFTDVEVCGDFVFTALDNLTDKANGKAIIFSTHNDTTKSMSELMQIPVGAVPDMVKITSDCSKLIVAVEGEAFESPANQITDPPGLIVIITFPDGINSNYNVVSLNFDNYNDRVDDLSKSGVRHVYRENGNPFSNDVEPEYIALNSDETKAYVVLQENNAIAVVDLVQQNITGIHGLGFKNWSMYAIDPSDKDGGSLLYPYNILGMYLPDGMKHFTFKGDNYIVTANEGDSKDYSFGSYTWTEEIRGSSITETMMPELDSTTLDQLGRETMLGRLKFAASPAEKDSGGRLKALYSYGARSFTIRRANDMSLVYDSGDHLSETVYEKRQALFNGHMGNPDNRPVEDIDERSDDKGVETEAIEVGEVDGVTLLFVANERPGTIFVYSLESDITKPTFQDIYDGIPDKRGRSWNQLYDDRVLSEVDPEDIHFIPASKSPTGKPILFATGSVTGTLSIIDINITPSPPITPVTTPKPCVSSVGRIAADNVYIVFLFVMAWFYNPLTRNL